MRVHVVELDLGQLSKERDRFKRLGPGGLEQIHLLEVSDEEGNFEPNLQLFLEPNTKAH